MLCWWPEQSPNCLQLPVLCSHSKVSPSLTCLSRFPTLPVHLPSPPPSLLSYLPLKAAEIFFGVCKNFAFCCFHCFLSIFFFCAYLPELSVLLYPTTPHSSLHTFDRLSRFFYVCLSYDMRHMKYGGYDIRNMSSLNFPQCYCYSSQPPDTFPFTFPVPFLSHNFCFISLISLPTLFALYSDFRLCK